MSHPDIAMRIIEAHPELLLRTTDRSDMFSTELWGAILSPEREGFSEYRYLLWRVFDTSLPLLYVMMLNPSKATHEQGDRTADGLVRRARRLGFGGIVIINCFAFRATDPSDMRRADDPVGPANDDIIDMVLSEDVDLLCAWGVNATHREREKEVKCAIRSKGCRPHVLRLCASGAPEHPLYIPLATGLSPWEPSFPATGS